MLIPSLRSTAPTDQSNRKMAQWRDPVAFKTLFLIAATAIPMPLPWLPDRRKDTATAIVAQNIVQRKRITLTEARRIAMEVLTRAEERRLRFAQKEADRTLALGSEQ